MNAQQAVPKWTSLESRCLTASRILSIFACALGVLGLIGWWRDFPVLRSFSSSFVPINPLTAVCLVLCGLSVILSQLGERSFLSTYAGRLLAAAVVFFGASRAISILSGFDFGMDLILFRQKMPTAGPAFLGRMSLGSAVIFILLGFALLSLNSGSRWLWALSEALIVLSLSVTGTSLADYIYGSNLRTISSSAGSLALPTILAFFALCLAALFSQPRRTRLMNLLVSDTGGGRSVRRLLPMVMGLLFALDYFPYLGVQKGLYEAKIAAALETVVSWIVIVAAILWHAKSLQNQDETIAAVNRDLEQKVREQTRELSTANSHLQKLNRFYLELSQVNQVIVRTRDREHLLSAVCRIAVRDGLFKAACVGLTEEGSQRLKPVAWAGVDEAYLEKICGSAADTREGLGPMGAACRENRQIVVTDVETGPVMSPWRREALLRGYRSIAACPLKEGERVVGAMGFYSDEPHFFQPDELRLLEKLVDDISFALAGIAQEKSLVESEQRFRTLFEGATDGIGLVNLETLQLVTVNPQMCKMLGYSSEELLHLTILDIHPAEDLPFIQREFSAMALGQSAGSVELRLLRKDGGVSPAEVTGRMIEIGKQELMLGIFRDITERKFAEQRVQERDFLLSESQRIAHVGAWTWESLGDIIRWSEETYHIYRVSPDTFVPTLVSFLDLIHPDDQPSMQAWLKACMSEEKPGDVEFRIILADGNIRILNGRGDILPATKDTPARIVGTVQDITERKKAEEELHKSEENYHRLIENIPVAVIMDDTEGRLVFANRRFRELFGMKNRDIREVALEDYVAPEWRQRLREIHDRRVRGDPVEERFEYEGIRSDGKRMWLEVFVTRVVEDGRTIGTQSAILDITGRKSAEQRIRILSQAVEQSPSIVFLTDAQARIVYVNPKFTEVTGYSLEEVAGRNPGFLKSGEIPPEEYQKLWQTVTHGGVWRGEFHDRRKNGELYWADGAITALRNDAGEITHYLGVQEVITERKRMEEEKRVLEEQFRQAQKMEAVGQLAGGVAHDFNNLLGVISGYSELLLEDTQDVKLRQQIEEIQKAGQRATALTRQLLAFSRKQILEARVLDLNGIISDIGKMLHRLIGEDVKLVLVAAPDLGKVKADPGQIEQVILNLAINSRDAMPKGGNLTIETTNVELDESYAHAHVGVVPGQYVMLAVSDTGEGMDADTLLRIFEPFFTTKKQGTGLGLATVYGIVKQSGGNIWVYSEPGRGTTFKVYFPRVDLKAEVTGVPVSQETAPGGSETILLVEDSQPLRVVAREFLERAGYAVLEVLDGSEAVRIAEQREAPIHLLLTDVVMPDISGRVVAEQVRSHHPETKVLYMSGYTDDAIIHYGVLEEGVALLPKPFTRGALIRKVRQVLDT
jgi:two-component system cell cycle sensor histidine kinase/response regulator CckA